MCKRAGTKRSHSEDVDEWVNCSKVLVTAGLFISKCLEKLLSSTVEVTWLEGHACLMGKVQKTKTRIPYMFLEINRCLILFILHLFPCNVARVCSIPCLVKAGIHPKTTPELHKHFRKWMNLFQVVILFASTLVTDVARGFVHSSHSHQCDVLGGGLKRKRKKMQLN